MSVLEIYRITLLSNNRVKCLQDALVLEIYRITLLSNLIQFIYPESDSFRDLQNYTTLKQGYCFQYKKFSFRDLQNYTTLKHIILLAKNEIGFRDLQNYTTLKRL